MNEDIDKRIASEIGYFFLEEANKKEPDMVKAVTIATKAVRDLGIHRVEYKNNFIEIVTERPGLLIGVKGSTIDALTKFLKEDLVNIINFQSIKIIEERVLNSLYSFEYVLGLEEDYIEEYDTCDDKGE